MIRIKSNQSLIKQMIWRDIVGRYQGSVLGLVWSFLNPLFMLGIYTFVFSVVFTSRRSWNDDQASTASFAIILFVGLIIHGLLREMIGGAPNLIVSKVNYVKKVIFPLKILPVVALGGALFHGVVSFIVLILAQIISTQSLPPLTSLWLPVVLLPFLILLLGFSWGLASLGVYLRDINQLLTPIITALLFISPIFFPTSALPEFMQSFIFLNPVSLIVQEAREVLIFGNLPDFIGLGIYLIVAILVLFIGLFWFQKTRKGFADVL